MTRVQASSGDPVKKDKVVCEEMAGTTSLE